MTAQEAQGSIGPLNTVGHNVPRIDAYERVTGKATYTRDVRVPGMLYARVRILTRASVASTSPEPRRVRACAPS